MLERPTLSTVRNLQLLGDSVPEISIIIPARNEEANIAACLRSLSAQEGVAFEIIVVDDDSSDRTVELASNFLGVTVISATREVKLAAGNRATGKNNAVIQGVLLARANLLLFTDADTIHLPQSLLRAINEAQAKKADLLSYSPEQTVVTLTERAVMPVIFSELASQYPFREIRGQNLERVAANGQYILVSRTAYEVVGGHAAVAAEILEDVALATRFRNSGFRVYFRYGGDSVRTRMYRNWQQLREGWTKNLVLLFPSPIQTTLRSLLVWCLASSSLIFASSGIFAKRPLRLIAAALLFPAYKRIRTSHFSWINSLIALAFGPPIFAYLLMRSSKAHRQGEIMWKGRAYARNELDCTGGGSAIKRELRAEN